jgi:hypothetical protein
MLPLPSLFQDYLDAGGFEQKDCQHCLCSFAREFATNNLGKVSLLHRDVLKKLTNESDDVVCRVLSTSRGQGTEWADQVQDSDEVLKVFLHSSRGVQVFEECLRVPQFRQYVRARRRDVSALFTNPRDLDTVPHALAHHGRADLLGVLVGMYPNDQSLQVRTSGLSYLIQTDSKEVFKPVSFNYLLYIITWKITIDGDTYH